MHFSIDSTIQNLVVQLNASKLELVLATRDLILSSNKEIKEKIKFGRITFYKKETDLAFLCIKAINKHIEVGFFDGHRLEDPNNLLKGKAQKIRRLEVSILNTALKKQIEAWILTQLNADIDEKY